MCNASFCVTEFSRVGFLAFVPVSDTLITGVVAENFTLYSNQNIDLSLGRVVWLCRLLQKYFAEFGQIMHGFQVDLKFLTQSRLITT